MGRIDDVKFDSLFNVSLETILLALQPPEDVEKLELSPRVTESYRQVSIYRDLLLLGDLPTITQVCCVTKLFTRCILNCSLQEMRVYEWLKSAHNLGATGKSIAHVWKLLIRPLFQPRWL